MTSLMEPFASADFGIEIINAILCVFPLVADDIIELHFSVFFLVFPINLLMN